MRAGILFLVAAASAYMQLDFKVMKGHEFKHFQKRALTNSIIENEALFYLANIEMGSDNQKVGVLLDTGSSDLWVPQTGCVYGESVEWVQNASPAEAAANSQQCEGYGSYSPSSLSTFKRVYDDVPFSIQYADESYALGYWAQDLVSFGPLALLSLTFGVADNVTSDIGVLGIGMMDLESSNSSLADSFEYKNFPAALKDEGLIKSNSYSLYLGTNNVSEGLILFGGVDHGKYDGKLYRMHIANEFALLGDGPIYSNVILDGISGYGFEAVQQTPALLDSGTSLQYLPGKYVDAVASYLEATTFDDDQGMYVVPCLLLQLTDSISYYFSGVEIVVPIRDLLYQYDQCYLGMIDSGDGTTILGDTFLKSAYVVYDFDNLEIALAQAAVEPRAETIEDIVTAIPLAVKAPLYDYTSLEIVYTRVDGNATLTTRHVAEPTFSFNTGPRPSINLGGTAYATLTGPVDVSGTAEPLSYGPSDAISASPSSGSVAATVTAEPSGASASGYASSASSSSSASSGASSAAGASSGASSAVGASASAVVTTDASGNVITVTDSLVSYYATCSCEEESTTSESPSISYTTYTTEIVITTSCTDIGSESTYTTTEITEVVVTVPCSTESGSVTSGASSSEVSEYVSTYTTVSSLYGTPSVPVDVVSSGVPVGPAVSSAPAPSSSIPVSGFVSSSTSSGSAVPSTISPIDSGASALRRGALSMVTGALAALFFI